MVVVVGARKKEKKKESEEQWSVVRVTVQSSEPNVDP